MWKTPEGDNKKQKNQGGKMVKISSTHYRTRNGIIKTCPIRTGGIIEIEREIIRIIRQEKGDVCQIGLEVGYKYGKNERELAQIWTMAQNIFRNEWEGKPYTLREEAVTLYANRLANIILTRSFINVIPREDR